MTEPDFSVEAQGAINTDVNTGTRKSVFYSGDHQALAYCLIPTPVNQLLRLGSNIGKDKNWIFFQAYFNFYAFGAVEKYY